MIAIIGRREYILLALISFFLSFFLPVVVVIVFFFFFFFRPLCRICNSDVANVSVCLSVSDFLYLSLCLSVYTSIPRERGGGQINRRTERKKEIKTETERD